MLLDAAMRSVVIMSLTGAVVLVMRRASAAARHWVWLLGFAGILLLPALSISLPHWRVLPRVNVDRAVSYVIELPTETAPAITPAPIPVQSQDVQPQTKVSSAKIEHVAAAPVQPLPPHRHIVLPWTFWIAAIWLTGSLMMLIPVLVGYLSLWILQGRCARISQGEWSALLNRVRGEMGISRNVRLLTTPKRTMPMTWGLWRAHLLLPAESSNWPIEQRRSVLLHELAHVRRFDCLTQLLAQIGCAAYWFNPIVWVGWRRMQIERETACDDLVLSRGAKASAYADHLLQSAAKMETLRFVGSAALAMARASTLEIRMRAILDSRRDRRGMTIRAACLTMILLVGGLVPVAMLRAQENPSNPQPAVTPAPATQPDQSNLSIEDRMRIRRQTQIDARGSGSATQPSAEARGPRGGFAGSGPSRGGRAQMAPGEGPTCAFDATIYDVRMPANQIGRLDVNALTQAASTPASFENALAELGTIMPLYRANQSVRLAFDSISMGTTVPYVSSSTTNARGQQISSVAYSNVGALFDLMGKSGTGSRIDLDLSIELSAITEGTTETSPGVKPPNFRRSTLVHKGSVQADQPFVVVSVDASNVDANGKAVAYIARVTLGKPEAAVEPNSR